LSFDRTMSSRRFKVALRPRLSAITEHPKMDFADYERRLTSLQGVLQLIQQAYLGTPERAIIVLEGSDTSGKGGIVRRLGWPSIRAASGSIRSLRRTNMSAPSTTCSGSGGACPSRDRSSFSIDPGMGAFWSNASKVSRRKRSGDAPIARSTSSSAFLSTQAFAWSNCSCTLRPTNSGGASAIGLSTQ
jgi:hypothetical protein